MGSGFNISEDVIDFALVSYTITCHHAPDPAKPGFLGLFAGTKPLSYKQSKFMEMNGEDKSDNCRYCGRKITLPGIRKHDLNGFPSLVFESWSTGMFISPKCHDISYFVFKALNISYFVFKALK